MTKLELIFLEESIRTNETEGEKVKEQGAAALLSPDSKNTMKRNELQENFMSVFT